MDKPFVHRQNLMQILPAANVSTSFLSLDMLLRGDILALNIKKISVYHELVDSVTNASFPSGTSLAILNFGVVTPTNYIGDPIAANQTPLFNTMSGYFTEFDTDIVIETASSGLFQKYTLQQLTFNKNVGLVTPNICIAHYVLVLSGLY